MADRLAVVSVEVCEGVLVDRGCGEDGRVITADLCLVATVADGRVFGYPQVWSQAAFNDDDCWWVFCSSHRSEAEALADAIRAKGSINPDLWVEDRPVEVRWDDLVAWEEEVAEASYYR